MNENQQHEFPDELISAYLDGELSPAEKVRVEEQLMDSAEHRRLFEELKALRRSLQSLPAEALGEDFAARVLRRAERELLADVSGAEKTKAKEPVADEPVVASVVSARPQSSQLDHGARRGLVWSVVATAAAVGFLVLGPLFNDDTRNISQLPDEPAQMRPAPADQEALAPSNNHERAKDSVEQEVASPAAPIDRARRGDGSQAKHDHGAARDLANGFSPALESAVRDEENRKQESQANLSPQAAGSRYNASANFENSRSSTSGAAAVPTDKDRADNEAPAKETAEAAAEFKIADSARALGPASGFDDRFGGAGGALPPGSIGSADRLQSAKAAVALSVVSLDVTQEALAAHFFDRLLERHDIQVELAQKDRETEQFARNGQLSQAVSADVLTDPSNRAASPGEGTEAGDAQGGADADVVDTKGKLAEAQDDAVHEDVAIMYVVASQEQIDGLLRDLQAQSGDVLAMTYDGAEAGKKSGHDQAWPEITGRQRFRESGDMKNLEDLRAEARLAAAIELGGASAAEKPQSSAAAEVEADNQVAAAPANAIPQADGDERAESALAEKSQSGYARRLPLRSFTEGEKQLRSTARGANLPAPAPVVGDAPAQVAAEESLADGVAEGNVDPAGPPSIELTLPLVDAVEGAAPAAPSANEIVVGRDKLAKAKEQAVVKVLFVLRAVKPLAPPAEPVDAPSSDKPPR